MLSSYRLWPAGGRRNASVGNVSGRETFGCNRSILVGFKTMKKKHVYNRLICLGLFMP